MASTSKQFETDELEVAGVSRSGRVYKKSSKLMYFDSTNNNINKKKKNKHSKKHQSTKQPKRIENYSQNQSQIANIDYNAEKTQKRSKNQQKKISTKYNLNQKKMKTESSTDASLPSNSDTESESAQTNNELQTPDYTTYDEESLNSEEEFLNSKVKMPTPKPKKAFSPNVIVETGTTLVNQNYVFTGYKLWSNEMKKEIFKKYPNMDVAIVTVRLGEMWTKMSINDRNNWHYRAQKLTEKMESLQHNTVLVLNCLQQIKKDWLNNSCNQNGFGERRIKQSFKEVKLRPIELQPIDVAAHLKLLGESLMLIGARFKHYDKPVVISDCITVLLDSLLCAMGSLVCLTQQVPIIRIDNSYTFLRTLENIAYIMPGL